jgi:hypothetical protein
VISNKGNPVAIYTDYFDTQVSWNKCLKDFCACASEHTHVSSVSPERTCNCCRFFLKKKPVVQNFFISSCIFDLELKFEETGF